MNRLSGGNQNLMLNALTYLRLIKPDGKPERLLEQIVDSLSPEKQGEYKTHLAAVLKGAYPFLFDGSGDFDLERSTSASFDEKFRGEGVSGETVLKCEAFFISAAQEAGIKISRLILEAKKKGPKRAVQGGASKIKGTKTENAKEDNNTPPPKPPSSPMFELSQWYVTFKPAFDKLPDFSDPHWTNAEREKWINLVKALADAYIENDSEG